MTPEEDFTGLLFFDENDQPLEDDAMHLEKARSFGGNRSAAGAYAARIRWGNRNGQTSDEMRASAPLDDAQLLVNSRQADMVQEALGELPRDEAISVFHYAETYNQHEMNALLRGTELRGPQIEESEEKTKAYWDEIDSDIVHLDSLFSRVPPLTEDIVTVRGLTLPSRADEKYGWYRQSTLAAKLAISNLQVGDSFVDDGFMSTSSLKEPSFRFNGSIRMEVVIPKGMKAFPLHRFNSEFETEEKEWLLPRGVKFRVVGRKSNAYPRPDFPEEHNYFDGTVTIRLVAEPA